MELWTSFWSDLTHFISEHGLLAVAGIVFLKSAGIPLPGPADLLVVSVGVQARTGDPTLWDALVVLSVATVLGASLLYVFVRWLGPEDVVHYGHYVGLGPRRVQAAEAELHARGERAILVARLFRASGSRSWWCAARWEFRRACSFRHCASPRLCTPASAWRWATSSALNW